MGKKRTPRSDTERLWDDRARLLRIMAHPARLMILERLCRGPCCVTEVNQCIDLPQPHLSQHIAALRRAQLIACHRNGPLRCYYVIRPTLVEKLIRLLRQDHPIRARDRAAVVREAQRARRAAGREASSRD